MQCFSNDINNDDDDDALVMHVRALCPTAVDAINVSLDENALGLTLHPHAI